MNVRKSLNNHFNEIGNLYHELCVKIGISDSESIILYVLNDSEEPLTQSDICHYTGISKQTLNSTIKKYVEEGILELDDSGKKSKTITVTKRGQTLIKEKIIPIVELEDRVYSKWSKEEVETYLALTAKFKNQLAEEVVNYVKK